MTSLTKPVSREVNFPGMGIYIVTLLPGGVLRFRQKGKRTAKDIGLIQCERLATIVDLNARYKEKLERFQQRKKLGMKSKRPRNPNPHPAFSKTYYQALGK